MPEHLLLAFDFGLRRIGVAVGNTLTRQARPLCIISAQTRTQRFDQIRDLLQQWQPDRVIVGLPLALEGGEQPATAQARRFANQLRGRFGIAVELVDERHSSMEAQQILGNHDADDAMAAAVILQRYLDGTTPVPDGGHAGAWP